MKCEAVAKNPPFGPKIFKKSLPLFLIALLLAVGMVGNVQAQMFSVGGEEGPRYDTPLSEIYLGLETITNTYEGGSVEQMGEGAFAFEGPILRLGYNGQGFDFFMGTGGKVTGIDEAAYFDIGGNIDLGIRLYRSEKLLVQLPFQIASRYTNITSDQIIPTLSRFQFGSLTVGAGANILARPFKNIRIEARAIPNYGFAFASGGFFGGSLGAVAAEGRLYLDRLFDDVGLSLGYKYHLRNYDIDEDAYDYKLSGHSVNVGITF